MKLSIETAIYNERRYGKPYIGILSQVDGKVIRWGQWIGTPGEAGLLEIEVEPFDAVMHGQKDWRGNNSTPRYATVQEDGSLLYGSKVEAIKDARGRAK